MARPRRLARPRAGCAGLLTDGLRSLLECGHSYFEDLDLDEDQLRAAWFRWRGTILAAWDRPGECPVAYWRFERDWPPGAVSEAHAVYLLPDTTVEERQAIEERWLRQLEVTLLHSTGLAAAREMATREMPARFFDAHAPAIHARQEAERLAFKAELARLKPAAPRTEGDRR